jgi:tRNA (guanine-N7-)-methyltransferase
VHIRSFHPRRGRVSALQAETTARLWPALGVDVDGRRLDLAELFGRPVPVVLEIGFGTGEATADLAAAEPEVGVLAVEVHTPGIGRLLHQVEQRALTNVRVARGDAVELVRDMLAPGSLAGVRILFPDPWPKARHHKRRLVSPWFVDLLASRMAAGAVLHLATDWPDYAAWMQAVLAAGSSSTGLVGGVVPRPAWRPVTPYERRGVALGHPVTDLRYEKRTPARSAAWQPDAECGALAGGGVELDLAAVGVHDRGHDRQPQTGAAVVPAAGVVGAEEALEHP